VTVVADYIRSVPALRFRCVVYRCVVAFTFTFVRWLRFRCSLLRCAALRSLPRLPAFTLALPC